METIGPPVLARRPFRFVKPMVFGVSVFGHVFLRAFKTRAGALLRLLGLPRATFKATTKNTALRRDWRSVWGLFWPKWAWHPRGVHIFKKLVTGSTSGAGNSELPCRVEGGLGGGPKAVSLRKTYGFWRVRFWSCFSKGLQNTCGCTPPPFGLPRATFKATTKNTALRRDWRSVWGLFWPKWAWHLRWVHIFQKLVFGCFSEIHAVRRVLRSLGGSWASPGTLWGGPGGPTTRVRSRPL